MPRLYDGRVFEYIAYIEQRENHGTMILDGVCYSDIHVGRVILYVWGSPPVGSLFWSFPGKYLVISTNTFFSRCLQTPVSPLQCHANNNKSFKEGFNDWAGRGCGDFVHGEVTKIAPSGDETT